MRQLQRIYTISAALLPLALGIMLGVLPRNWVEVTLGIDPDGGSGFLEALLALIPFMIGLALASRAFTPFRRREHVEGTVRCLRNRLSKKSLGISLWRLFSYREDAELALPRRPSELHHFSLQPDAPVNRSYR
jgi:hypothetical protein